MRGKLLLTSILILISLSLLAWGDTLSDYTSLSYPGISTFVDATWSPQGVPDLKVPKDARVRYASIAIFIPLRTGFLYLIGPFNSTGMHIGETYLEMNLFSGLGVRLGAFRSRFGRMNEKHLHSLNFTSHPLAIYKYLGPNGLRGTGVALTYLMPTDTFWELEYERYLSGSGYLRTDKPVDIFRSKWSWSIGDESELMASLSWLSGESLSGHYTVYSISLSYYWLPWERRLYRDLKVDLELFSRRTPNSPALTGGYLEVSLKPGKRAQRWSYRYDNVELSAGVREERHSVSFTYEPSEFTRYRLQLTYDPQRDRIYPAFQVGYLFQMGQHPAHTF